MTEQGKHISTKLKDIESNPESTRAWIDKIKGNREDLTGIEKIEQDARYTRAWIDRVKGILSSSKKEKPKMKEKASRVSLKSKPRKRETLQETLERTTNFFDKIEEMKDDQAEKFLSRSEKERRQNAEEELHFSYLPETDDSGTEKAVEEKSDLEKQNEKLLEKIREKHQKIKEKKNQEQQEAKNNNEELLDKIQRARERLGHIPLQRAGGSAEHVSGQAAGPVESKSEKPKLTQQDIQEGKTPTRDMGGKFPGKISGPEADK